MARIAIVTDSAACIPNQLKQELGIHQVAFELVWDGAVYQDGVGLSPTEFYQRFRQAHTYPTTSQPPLGAFATLYTQLAKKYDGIVSIHVSAELTGTVHTAKLAAQQVNGVPIRVLDSRTATIAEGFVVLAAARAAAADGTFEQVIDAAERVISSVDFFVTLKTVEHIHRGGRLGEAAVLLGSQLKVTPILTLKNGRVSLLKLTRSWEKALGQIVDLVVERIQPTVPLAASLQSVSTGNSHVSMPHAMRTVHASAFHADVLQDAEWLRDQLCLRVPCAEFYITEFTPVMGAHTGPDVAGLAFYVDD